MLESSVILFDGVCNLCCGWVRFLIRRDKKMKFRFASMQSESGKRLMTSLDLNDNRQNTIVYFKDNQLYIESSAVLKILEDLGGIWVLFKVFNLIPEILRNHIYRYIANRRYALFGKRSTCIKPTPEYEKRFLL